jgi:hypothetical protein
MPKDTPDLIWQHATQLLADDVHATIRIREAARLRKRIAAMREFARRCLKDNRATAYLQLCDDVEAIVRGIEAEAREEKVVRSHSIAVIKGLRSADPAWTAAPPSATEQQIDGLRRRIRQSRS